MIDRVGIFIQDALAPIEKLSGVKPMRAGISGFLGNMRFADTFEGVYISGSLPKFLYGNNALPLTRQTLCNAIEKLEIDSGVDLKKGLVYQQEIGTTIPVKEPPVYYIATWGELPRYDKRQYNSGQTVTYTQKSKSFSGYDKGAEISPSPLPEPFSGGYALRLEFSLKKQVKRFYGRTVSPWDICKPEYYNMAVSGWKTLYFQIPKKKVVLFNTEGLTPKRWKDILAAYGLQKLGYNKANTCIQGGITSGDIDKSTASRIRKTILDLSNDPSLTDSDELTREIDSKVRSIALYAR